MKKINRIDFLKWSGSTALLPVAASLFNQASQAMQYLADEDLALLQRLNNANDKQVVLLLNTINSGTLIFSRKIAYDVAALTAAFCSEGSRYHNDERLVEKMLILVQFLAAAQAADGTVNVGNLESPPDTAFLVEILGAAAAILKEQTQPALNDVVLELKKVLIKAGEALVTGGVHTPNHRWVICAALAQLHAVYPNKKYTERIEDWLGEGVFNDAEGYYPERSGTYSAVENACMIAMARFLKKPALLNHVRKNLNLFYYHIEPDGQLVSMDSRRQDQYVPRNSNIFYLQYRYMALHDNNALFATITKQMETQNDFEEAVLAKSLFSFLENKLLQKKLPTVVAIPDYEKLITTSHLLRIKRGATTLSLFGGIDWPMIIASGRSCSPNFFTYQNGAAALKYMRLSAAFFSMGYFYSEGIKKTAKGYQLHKKIAVPYYQPLAKDKRRKDGDYSLTPSIDNRFWNKMDFSKRPVSNVKTLETTITLTAAAGKAQITIEVTGMDNVAITIELCFKEGGQLSGVTDIGNDNYLLDAQQAVYKYGADAINFGPGLVTHKQINELEGERYSTHFGSLRTKGMHVYITGKTPLTHVIKFS
ncbi:MAG: hypothetical protein EAZ16_07280 [Sphingobacteriales bacterium]|nr:MAG: hypothetical protein EAZ16_07280 [Sphingobacteriales bacterium]